MLSLGSCVHIALLSDPLARAGQPVLHRTSLRDILQEGVPGGGVPDGAWQLPAAPPWQVLL